MATSPLAIVQNLQNAQFQRQSLAQGQQRLNIQQQQEQMQEQQNLRQARQEDLDFHQRLSQMGAAPVVRGMVQDTQTIPDVPGVVGRGQSFSVLRKADPSRTIKFKDSEGEDVTYELPDAYTQAMHQLQIGAPARAAQVEQAGQTAQATTTGTAAANLQAQRNLLNDPDTSVALDQDAVNTYGLPKSMVGMRMTKDQVAQLSSRVTPAEVRAGATLGAADTRNQGAMDRAQLRAQTQQQLLDAKNDFQAQQQQQKLGYQDRWQQARNAITGNTQNNLNSRVLLRQFDTNQAQHGKLLNQIYGEQQKQLEAQALLDPNSTADGEQFTDPWSGKSTTMNAFQRARIKAGLDASNAQVADLRNSAQQIEEKYNLGAFTPGAGAQPQPGGAAAPNGTNPAPAAGAGAGAGSGGGGQQAGGPRPLIAVPRVNPRTSKPYAVGDTVKLKGGKTVTIKSFNQDGSFNY